MSAQGEPRRPLEPCDPDCPGWGIFHVDRCTVHGDGCDCWDADCETNEIEACDSCWYGETDPPGDDYYQEHPACQAALAKERGQ